MTKAPHIVQYQGSKRLLAPQILRYVPRHVRRFIEPFSGTAAMTIAAALDNRAESYLINDINAPLVALLKNVVDRPDDLLASYSNLWNEQFAFPDGHLKHFYEIRDRFNAGDVSPANMLYLLARCVKGSVRYGRNGKFNQSPDKRRHGTSPKTLAANIPLISRLLNGKAIFSAVDYREVFAQAVPGDLIYMDPPYQGVSSERDNRYVSGLQFKEFADSLYDLNRRGIDYLISYDGTCGEKGYGTDLPSNLGCAKVLLKAGWSSQALLLGRKALTYEALYVSKGLVRVVSTADFTTPPVQEEFHFEGLAS